MSDDGSKPCCLLFIGKSIEESFDKKDKWKFNIETKGFSILGMRNRQSLSEKRTSIWGRENKTDVMEIDIYDCISGNKEKNPKN